MKLGLFEAASGTFTGLIGAGVYHATSKFMGWTQPAVLEAAAVIAVGRFLWGLIASDSHGNNRIRANLDMRAGLDIANDVLNDAMNYFNNQNTRPDLTIHPLQLIQNSHDKMASAWFKHNLLLSLAKNVAAGVVGFALLNCVLESGALTLPVSQIVVDATLGVITEEVGKGLLLL